MKALWVFVAGNPELIASWATVISGLWLKGQFELKNLPKTVRKVLHDPSCRRQLITLVHSLYSYVNLGEKDRREAGTKLLAAALKERGIEASDNELNLLIETGVHLVKRKEKQLSRGD